MAIKQVFQRRVASLNKHTCVDKHTPTHKRLTRQQRIDRRITVFVRQIRTNNTCTSLAEAHSQQACDLLNCGLQQVHLVLTWKRNIINSCG